MVWQNGLQFDASGNLLVSGPAGTNPFAATTAAETAASVTPSNVAYPEGDIRRYGALGAGEDNTAHINTVLSVVAQSGRPALLAGLNLKSTGGHSQDVSKVAIDGQGAIIDYTGMSGSGTAWTITGSGASSALNVQNARHAMQNVVHIGVNANTTVGLFLQGPNDAGSASFLNFHNVVFEQFNTACLVGNNTYICKFFGCYFTRSATNLSLPTGLTNAAEQYAFYGCGFTDSSSIAINNVASNTSLILNGCSIDGNNITFLQHGSNARTYMTGCHVECLNIAAQTVPMFNIQGGNLFIDGGDIIADGTPPGPFASVFAIGSGATVTIDGNPLLNNINNTGNTTGVLCAGAGQCTILSPIKTFDTTKIPPILGIESQFNLLQDGGFESTTFKDNICIVSDVSSTVTMPIASPGLVNWNPHRQLAGQPVVFTSTGTLPAALTSGVTYYVLAAGLVTGAFEIAATPGGTAINFADAGTGTHTATAVITNRTVGSHISISNATTQKRSGSRSLAAVLNGGVGSSHAIIVPCIPNRLISASGWYRDANGQAVAVNVNTNFCSDIIYGQMNVQASPGQAVTNYTNWGGVPTFIGLTQSNSLTLASPQPTTFTQFNTPLTQVPSWARYMVLVINTNSLFSNTWFLDDLVINGY